jgi:DNA (cytosine-5)-methyltransferase 1
MPGKLTAVSLFSGCGGFDWGATEAGVEIVWANDSDQYAAAAYRQLFPNVEFVEGDVAEVTAFPKAEVLIGCYPCTGFSLAARRRWKSRKGKRDLKANKGNFLYRQFLRALTQVKPRYLVVENVRGMSSADDGWFLRRQIGLYRRFGYNIKAKLLDARDYGVAQSRKRLFLVGVHRSVTGFEYDFPCATHGPGTDHPHSTLTDVIAGMAEWPEGEYCTIRFHGHYLTRNRKRRWDQPSYTIVAHSHHIPLHPMGEPMVYVAKDQWALQGDANRRLSWRECAAIQGLPARLKPVGSLDQTYKVIGNAVPPAFGRELLKSVVAHEEASVPVAQVR